MTPFEPRTRPQNQRKESTNPVYPAQSSNAQHQSSIPNSADVTPYSNQARPIGAGMSARTLGRGKPLASFASTFKAKTVPILRPDFSGLSAISAGAARTCAIQHGGAYCWGTNHSGEVGDGSAAEERRSPTPVLLDKPQNFFGMALSVVR